MLNLVILHLNTARNMRQKGNKGGWKPGVTAPERISEAAARAAAEGRAPRLLFVCLGNICRSPAAQGIVEAKASERGIDVECDSAGFYGGHAGDLPDRRMREAAWQRGYRLDHRARRIREADFFDFDILVGMDSRNLDDLHDLAPTPEHERRIVAMSDLATAFPDADCVPDPYYEGPAGFQYVLDLLENSAGVFLDILEADGKKG